MRLGDQLPFLTWTQPMAGTEHDCQSTAAEINKCDLDFLVWIIIQSQKSFLRPIHVPAIRRALITAHSVVHRSRAVCVRHGFALIALVQFCTRMWV